MPVYTPQARQSPPVLGHSSAKAFAAQNIEATGGFDHCGVRRAIVATPSVRGPQPSTCQKFVQLIKASAHNIRNLVQELIALIGSSFLKPYVERRLLIEMGAVAEQIRDLGAQRFQGVTET